jgi:phosphoenolpyruvate-protein kinase (PTS system EI component)
MSPTAIPAVKAAVRAATAGRLAALARESLSLPTAGEIEAMLRRELAEALLAPVPSSTT